MAGPQTQTRRITIAVDTKGAQELKAITQQLGGLNQNTKQLADSFAGLSSATVSFLGGLSIRQLIGFSDEIQTLNNRLLAITGSQAKATELLGQLSQASRDTNSSIASTSEVFGRLTLALKDANIDSSVMLDITKTLVNTYRLSGSSAEEAAGKVTSLAYALQQGGLKGRELRTVLRDNQVLGELLKKAFGGNIMEAANNGFITTSKLLEILHQNMDGVNLNAGQLSATFGESLTKVFEVFKIKLFEINQALGASGDFGKASQFAIDNMNVLIGLMTILAVGTIPALITQVVKLGISFGALSEPVLIITAMAAALLSTSTAMEKFLNPIDRLNVAIYKLDLTIIGFLERMAKAASYFPNIGGRIAGAVAGLLGIDLKHSEQQITDLTFKAVELSDGVKSSSDKATDSTKKWGAAIQGAKKIILDKTPAELLAELNHQFIIGAVSVEEYNTQIQKVDLAAANKEFATGHKNLSQLQAAYDAFTTYSLNQQLKKGTLSYTEFDNSIRDLKLQKLNQDLDAGRISLEDYNKALASVQNNFSAGGAFRTGLQDYLNTIKTTSQGVADSIVHAFSNVEDAFVGFLKTGKFNFDKFTQDVLDDLLRIIVRASIIQPLATGLLSVVTPTPAYAGTAVTNNGYAGGSTGAPPQFAKGGVFGANYFADGGVFSTPTAFNYGKGKLGIMGEEGAEAVMPLTRGGDGSLGVRASVTPVTVNVINQSGNEVQQSTSTGPNGEQQIDILVTSKVRQGLANGQFDKVLKNSFGISRKGS